jgi:PAS domain S-box-containing protein
VGTKIYDNYYFLPPKRYIAKSLHEAILDRLINNLEERKELKEQLSKERGFSDQILQSLPAFFVAIDAEGRTRMMNETMLRKLGYTPEEVLGADYLHTFVPEKERDALAGVFRTLASSNQPTVSVNRILTKDGREITVEWHGRRVLKEDGSLDFYFGVGVDITERVMAEEALREREEMFRAIATAARDAIVILDDRGKVTYWNPAANEIFGYTAEEMLGKDLHQILAPEKHHGFYQEGYLQFRATGSGPMIGRTVELEGRRKDGSIFPFELSLSAFKRKGKWHALGVAREITERKRQEEALRESEQKYRIIFEATGTAMFLVERDATISDVNRVAEEMLGYAREEMVGKMRYMELAMPEEVNKVKDYSLKLLRGEIKGPVQYEIKARHKSGRAIPAIITVSMLPSIGRSIISLIDISKEKEREKELKERAEQLKDFLDIASHELRHPITLLKGYAITLEKHGNFLDSKAYASALQAIQDGSDRLVNVVEGLLDVSRIERGRYPIRKSEVNIRLLAEKAVEEMRTREGSRKIALDLPDDLDVAFIDPDGILRLFIILLENALKYSPSDSLIEVRGERLEGEIRFSVLDRGIGIPEEDREKIFERFYQVEDVLHHSKPGMGIGLYIAREIVEAHGGKIWYEHREGGGSVFYFTLPQ